MKIQFRTADDKQSTFNKFFDNFEDALRFYRDGNEPDEPCESSLDVVVLDEDGEIVEESNLLTERWYWEDGKLAHQQQILIIKKEV